MSAEVLAGELHLPLYVVRLEGLITRYLGETATKLRIVFDEVAKHRGVYLFDEFDAVGGHRANSNDVAEMRRVLNSFLQFVEEPNATDSIIVAATNHPEMLDSALLRRFEDVIQFNLPTTEETKLVLLANLKPLKFKQLGWKSLSKECTDLSQAELKQVAEDVVKQAIIKNDFAIKTSDVLDAVKRRKRTHAALLKIAS